MTPRDRLAAALRNVPIHVIDGRSFERLAETLLARNVVALEERLVARAQDMEWCNKDDDCYVEARGVRIAIEDVREEAAR